jgi:aryl-alcohol dehydrogenase-like predicted oxidoreductase
MSSKRVLGNSGLQVSTLCLGGNVFGWTADEPTSLQLLDAFVAAGMNFIDTADIYSKWVPGHKGGESETIIGNWLKKSGRRKDVVIATKVGMAMPGGKGLSQKWIAQAVEASLRRLQTDYIDLYQAHEDDPGTPLEETLEAFAALVASGKVRALGASNYKAPRLREALEVSARNGWPRYESLQPWYNLCDRAEYETELEPLCLKENVGVISYYSLASGFLTGKYRSEEDFGQSPRGGRMSKYLNERGRRILGALDLVAKQHDSTPTSVALAWLIARPGITAPIASATKLPQLNDLVAATRLTLTQEELDLLNQASAEAAEPVAIA